MSAPLFITFDRNCLHSEVYNTLQFSCLKNRAAYRRMLTVIVGSVKELVNPYAAGEVILIFRSFKELLYAPFQALDINLRFCINLPLAVIGGVAGEVITWSSLIAAIGIYPGFLRRAKNWLNVFQPPSGIS